MLSDDEDYLPLNTLQAQLTTHQNEDGEMDPELQLDSMPVGDTNAYTTNEDDNEDDDECEEEDVEILPNARRVQQDSDRYVDEDEDEDDDDDDDEDEEDNSNNTSADSDAEIEEDDDEEDDENDEDFQANGTTEQTNNTYENDDSEDDDIPLSAQIEKINKTTSTAATSTKQKPSVVKTKVKTEDDGWLPEDDIPLSKLLQKMRGASKKPKSKRKSVNNKRTVAKKENDVTKPKKKARKQKKEDDVPVRKFEKPGQRRETPPDNDPSRLFYESMYKEKVQLGKKSAVAETWMLRHGLLEDNVATRINKQLRGK